MKTINEWLKEDDFFGSIGQMIIWIIIVIIIVPIIAFILEN